MVRAATAVVTAAALALTPGLASAKAKHVPCGRTKAPHTNCGRHLGQHHQHKKAG